MFPRNLAKSLTFLLLSFCSIVASLGNHPYLEHTQTPIPTASPVASPSPDPRTTYEPATYGIPDTIAGYKVLAVQTLENTACMLPDTFRLILQAPDPDVNTFIEKNNSHDVQAELAKLDLTMTVVRWETTFAGPGLVWDWDKFIAGNDRWNNLMKNGCIKLGPAPTPAPTLTSTH